MIDTDSPFVFEVGALLRGGTMPEIRQQQGPSPVRIGPAMIAISEGTAVEVDATLTPLGDAIMVDADIHAQLTGQCVRCLAELTPMADIHISEVYAASPDFVQGEDADEDDELPLVEADHIDLTQAVIDEAGLSLPFSPQCADGCDEDEVPAPDGVSGETQTADPRWAGLEKFL